jgi:EAL domain-containing protein (putative c-di-GMP-specific phosphodiesterase class I)
MATIENHESLFLEYQPIINLGTNTIWGLEALARMDSSQLGRVGPLEFIPLAEKTKLIIPLGDKIIIKALNFLKRLESMGYEQLVMSINISAFQFLKSDFIEFLIKTLDELEINPENVCLEITESVFASDYQDMNDVLEVLRGLGVKSTIDDFGTGYSSFSRERELNVNGLKIDKFFMDKMLDLSSLEEAITGDIISMAHRLGHFTIAEGVEDEKQRQYLKDHNCDKIQGFLISRPLNEESVIEYLSGRETFLP